MEERRARPSTGFYLSGKTSRCGFTFNDYLIMEIVLVVVRGLVWCSILFTFIEVYLKINKLWKRKHERVVAESQSIMAESLSILSSTPLLVLYIFEHQYEGMLEHIIWFPLNILVILIGAGYWVRLGREGGLWQLILSSVRAERSEVGDLAKSFFKPVGSEKIIDILSGIALIDNELDDREKDFIETFVRTWGLPFSVEDIYKRRAQGDSWSFTTLRDSVKAYLAISPPAEQAAQLRDTIHALVKIDDHVSPEEALVSSEINGMLTYYVGRGANALIYEVYIAPQSEEKEMLLHKILPKAEQKYSAGGKAFLVDRFYSEEYAEITCNKYREFELLTFIVKSNSNGRSAG